MTALWDGLLGHSAKVSGLAYQDRAADPGLRRSDGAPPRDHIICVYADPFWEMAEVERVLRGLRRAGIAGPLRVKSDGATHLDVYRGNRWGIPPSMFFAAAGEDRAQTNRPGPTPRGARVWGVRPPPRPDGTESEAVEARRDGDGLALSS